MITTLRCAILTISDRSYKGERPDLSGPALTEQIKELGWTLTAKKIVPDDIEKIQNVLRELADAGDIDILLTTGGTGVAPRDVTPEATLTVIEKNVPGLAELMRMEGYKLNPHAMLGRGVAGIYKNTLILNLPGSPKGAVEDLIIVAPLLAHAVALIQSSPDAENGHQFKH
jgi:molybdopterin adenylyltransferase